jgi:hypothetical protein
MAKSEDSEEYDVMKDVKRLTDALAALGDPNGLNSDEGAISQLAGRFGEASEEFCAYLDRVIASKRDIGRVLNQHGAVARELADAATRIADVLVRYTQQRPEEMRDLLSISTEWPVLASIDPARDIRKVNRAPKGQAATFYKPVLEYLAKNAEFNFGGVRDPTFFHKLAMESSRFIIMFVGRGGIQRVPGLPWLLDYSDGSNLYTLSNDASLAKLNDPVHCREWVVALKYYLYLTLAPEPERSGLRKAWRQARLNAFNGWEPRAPEDAELHARLRSQGTPVEFIIPGIVQSVDVRWNWIGGPLGEAYFHKEFRQSLSALEKWWELTLKYTPDALFGAMTPLTEWTGNPMFVPTDLEEDDQRETTVFARCVEATLDAFLRLHGMDDGLKAVTGEKIGRLPRIFPSEIVPLELEDGLAGEADFEKLFRSIAKQP